MCMCSAQARVSWIGELHRLISVVTNLPRLQASQFDQGIDVVGAREQRVVQTYESFLPRLEPGLLVKAYEYVDSTLSSVGAYVSKWFAYQVTNTVVASHMVSRRENLYVSNPPAP